MSSPNNNNNTSQHNSHGLLPLQQHYYTGFPKRDVNSASSLAARRMLHRILTANHQSLLNRAAAIKSATTSTSPGRKAADADSPTSSSFLITGGLQQQPTGTYRAAANESIIIKSPFKHYQNQKRAVSAKTAPNPSASLVKSTAQVVNAFVSSFEKSLLHEHHQTLKGPGVVVTTQSANNSNNPSLNASLASTAREPASFLNHQRNQKARRTKRRNTAFVGLKPLTYVVRNDGPSIKTCIGIIKEPSPATRTEQLRGLYEQKLYMLEKRTSLAPTGTPPRISMTRVTSSRSKEPTKLLITRDQSAKSSSASNLIAVKSTSHF